MKRWTKSISVAGLVLLAVTAFTAHAQCPSSVTPPWSSASGLGGTTASVAPGLDGSACRLNATITVNGPGVNAFVRDNSPSDESHYRARFLLNADALGALNSIQSVKVFSATTANPANNLADVVRFSLFGNLSGTQKFLGVFTACSNQPSGVCTTSLPLASGTNAVEMEWVKGSSGALNVWVNNTNANQPTLTIPANSAAWGGVDYAVLGLISPSPAYRSLHVNQPVSFDRFESRRLGFIGT